MQTNCSQTAAKVHYIYKIKVINSKNVLFLTFTAKTFQAFARFKKVKATHTEDNNYNNNDKDIGHSSEKSFQI